MKKIRWAGAVVVPVMAVIFIMSLGISGCESAGDDVGISISPGAVTLASGINSEATSWPSVGGSTNSGAGSTTSTYGSSASNNNTVVFMADVTSDLALPLKWSVANRSLGYILNSSGKSAVYIRTRANGENYVIVEDQYGNTGMALVTQK